MGLKSGARDAGLGDPEESDDSQADDARTEPEVEEGVDDGSAEGEGESAEPSSTETDGETDGEPSGEASGEEDGATHRPSKDSIPYKQRRETVNEGREQVPYFLREAVVEGEDELAATLEELLGETVYKSDYREAAMVVAQRNPDLVADVLREWGYDLEES